VDNRRFDAFARTIADHRSRRDVLRALVGATVAGIVTLGERGASAATIHGRAPRSLNAPRTCHGQSTIPCGDGCCRTGSVCIEGGCATRGATSCGKGYCPKGSTCSLDECYPAAVTWGCSAESQCESQAPLSSYQYCYCGTTVEGDAVGYQAIYGCPSTEFFCTSSRECGRGSVCVDLTDGCGGCASAVCNPLCTV
jgi:hypothetical protein